ncbi:hypothetical protein CRG98_021471 [Punica granatum]|uniref:Uncharacterized protein n=1 Tax=Punica granatum TaxID=22663 RepID=A0A2I0JPG3_PUNGR|nr:hypothetical protein CRG98_021471 [Punica granatum]
MRDGTVKIKLDHWWVGFGLFWLAQTRMEATDPTGHCLNPTGAPRKIKRVQAFLVGFCGGSRLFSIARNPSRWWWWSLFGSKGLGSTRIAMQKWCNGGSRRLLVAKSVAHGSEGTPGGDCGGRLEEKASGQPDLQRKARTVRKIELTRQWG